MWSTANTSIQQKKMGKCVVIKAQIFPRFKNGTSGLGIVTILENVYQLY